MNDYDKTYYGEYADILEEKESWLVAKLQNILDQISTDPENRPAEHLLSRIKGADSLREKLQRKGYKKTDAEHALAYMSDVIGVRIVVHFVGDVYKILDLIEACDDWEVLRVKDYIETPKKNGYRSLHIILRIPFQENSHSLNTINVEIQLRTIAMDCWASLEHQLHYKKSNDQLDNPDLIADELGRCAAEMASTDLTMQTIRELINEEKDGQ